MKKIVALCIFSCAFIAISAFAQQDKVVVIPLNSTSVTGSTFFSNFGSSSDVTISSTYEKLRTLGSFTKTQNDTAIKVKWRSYVKQTGAVDQFVEYELRLSGQQGDTNYSGVVVYMDGATHREAIDPWGFWTGLPAGTYDVEVWIRGNATSTFENSGNFKLPVLVEEFRYKASPAPALP